MVVEMSFMVVSISTQRIEEEFTLPVSMRFHTIQRRSGNESHW